MEDASLRDLPIGQIGTRNAGRLRDNIVSPYGLAAISYVFFLCMCLTPPSVYRYYMHERDLMFLDPAAILFYTLCIASFCGGVWLVSGMRRVPRKAGTISTRISPTLFLVAPLTIGISAAIATLYFLLAYHPEFIVLLMAQQGAELKETVAFEVSSKVQLAPLVLTAVVWWAYWRSFDLSLSKMGRRVVNLALVVAIVSVLATATLILSRDILIMALAGLAVSYLARKTVDGRASFKFFLRAVGVITFCLTLFFGAFAFLRGISSVDDQIHQILGYTGASYNRLAAVVNGDLRYPFAGRGLYLCSFVAFNHTFNRLVPLGQVMNSPDQLQDWDSQFGAVTRAGLDGSLIWSGAFGYIFSDLGWLSFPFVFGYGILSGLAWNWIKRGKVIGTIMYPCIGFCILFWVGANVLLDSQRMVVLVAAIILGVYEILFARKSERA
jgi:hypothetical protein